MCLVSVDTFELIEHLFHTDRQTYTDPPRKPFPGAVCNLFRERDDYLIPVPPILVTHFIDRILA
jgi:hypothetical protein